MYKNELAYHISFVLALAQLAYSKMANNNFYQGSYDQYSAFADGQVFLDEEGNAVYQLRPDGSPHVVPAGDQSPYQDVQSPGVYSPGLDLGKLEDYGPLALNEVAFNHLADMDGLNSLLKEVEDEEMEDTIPYGQECHVVLTTQELMLVPTAQACSPSASLNGANIPLQAANAHPSANHACSPFASLNSRQVVLNVDFRRTEMPMMERPLATHNASSNEAVSSLTAAVQLKHSPIKARNNFPKPRTYKIKSVEQRAKEEKKRAANYLAVRKNRLTAAERGPALLQRLYFLEKVMEKLCINICPTIVGLPKGYGGIKFVPTTCEEKKLQLPSSAL